ncbi:hypothetical protein GE061_004790 [Apolygus lucorum]|uniref:Single domain-containing protein n=1 Tax=Apolygus lucorum TaxID=248454 RepID=A0A8S9X246_APOLU|nr:hypothetical protein GE061_004790 [Apolygus lucorum]
MHTWLILASLFGVAFTKAVNHSTVNHTEGFCSYHGIKIRLGEEAQPPGECYLTVCEEATYKQGRFHQGVSMVTCPTEGGDSDKVRTISETWPDCCDNPDSTDEE